MTLHLPLGKNTPARSACPRRLAAGQRRDKGLARNALHSVSAPTPGRDA